jgi:glycosyltransferase involved in cell wall biosynthesis
MYFNLMRRWIRRYASKGLAPSQRAANSLFGSRFKTNICWSVLCYGIDLASFSLEVDRRAILRKLGIPADSFVVGHIGRFVSPKNHFFFIEVAAEILRRKPQTWFLLVGDGQLRPAILDKAKRLGIRKQAIFLGARDDVPYIMNGAIDAFLFPSLYEGLGLAIIEAQAAGVPCVISDVVPEEADVVPELISRLSLDKSVEEWAEAVLKSSQKQCITPRAALEKVAQSPFNIKYSVEALIELYET